MDEALSIPVPYLPPTGRAGSTELELQARAWVENPVLQEVLEAVDGMVLLVNRQHQILVANAPVLRATGAELIQDLQGLRLGEALGCIHVAEGREGCGTSPACAQCGVAQALASIRQGRPRSTFEALLTRNKGGKWEAMELRVRSTPFPLPKGELILLVGQDISAEKRRDALESTFFHDVLNTLSGLRGWCQVLQHGLGDKNKALRQLDILSDRVIGEVRTHRLIIQAERDELSLHLQKIPVQVIFQEWSAAVESHPSIQDRRLELRFPEFQAELETDPDLLRRILVNMTLNALEATPQGGHVECWCEEYGDKLQFCVQNPSFIPSQVQGRIFQRSFSTKATRGRGLGTYSMKLFGEGFLKGKVGFTSSEREGTCFHFAVSRAFPVS